ncbi:MAG: DUF2304 domain-containing protein [Candidatus Eisenbacteria bacterium]|nr:DUF2304 domain-containing protein [Candidatus Eisenbacteria bacterium]
MISVRVARVAIIVSIILVLIVLDMVRKRRLREKYALIWLFTVAGMTVLVVWQDLLLWLTAAIGAIDPSSTLFLFGILFALAILLHLSVKVSDSSTQLRILAKEVAMLHAKVAELSASSCCEDDSAGDTSAGGGTLGGKT